MQTKVVSGDILCRKLGKWQNAEIFQVKTSQAVIAECFGRHGGMIRTLTLILILMMKASVGVRGFAVIQA